MPDCHGRSRENMACELPAGHGLKHQGTWNGHVKTWTQACGVKAPDRYEWCRKPEGHKGNHKSWTTGGGYVRGGKAHARTNHSYEWADPRPIEVDAPFECPDCNNGGHVVEGSCPDCGRTLQRTGAVLFAEREAVESTKPERGA